MYPPKNSSAPSPDSTTVTCSAAFFATKYSGTSAGSATGSSRCQTIFGSASIISAGPIFVGIVVTPRCAADSCATSISEYPGTSYPTVKVRMFGLNSRASATTAVESMPEDRNAPTGTSDRMWMRTLSRRVAWMRRYRSAGASTGVGRNRGWWYRRVANTPPARYVKHSPEPTRPMPLCSVPGSGTYCSVR